MSKSIVFIAGQKLAGTMLTVLGPVNDTWRVVECLCDCGNIVQLPYQQLYYGKYSCGCTRRGRKCIFHLGDRVEGTMLTIVRPLRPDSWRIVVCKCDCGKVVELLYNTLFSGRYSCGCTRKTRTDAVDYTGMTVHNGKGNRGYGRRITILYQNEEQRWVYVCECCAETFVLPRGMERGIKAGLKDLAVETCPNFKEYYPADHIERLHNAYMAEYGVSLFYLYRLTTGASRDRLAEELAPYYERRNVKYKRRGGVSGFYGFPTKSAPKSDANSFIVADDTVTELVPVDPDGFTELDSAAAVGVEPTSE